MNAAVATQQQDRPALKRMPPLPGPGRPHGAFNRSTKELVERIQKTMKQRYGIDNYDPVIAIAEIACDVTNPLEIRLLAHSKVAPYVRPQLKQIELTGAEGGPLEIKHSVADELLALMVGDKTGELAKVIDSVATEVKQETDPDAA